MRKQSMKNGFTKDLKNQSKITSFFKKRDTDKTLVAKAEKELFVASSSDLKTVSVVNHKSSSRRLKKNAATLKHSDQNIPNSKKTAEIILLTESSSDSEHFETTSELKITIESSPTIPQNNSVGSQHLKLNQSLAEPKLYSSNVWTREQKSEAETHKVKFNEISSGYYSRNRKLNKVDCKSHCHNSSLIQTPTLGYPNDCCCSSSSMLNNIIDNFEEDGLEINKSELCSSGTNDYNNEQKLQISSNEIANSAKSVHGPVDTNNGNTIGLYTPPRTNTPTLRSPIKSPKSIVSYFSPIRHLRKKSASNSPEFNSAAHCSTGTLSNQKEYLANPYYYRNFITIVDSVSSDPHHNYLINEAERNTIKIFRSLSKQAQCLYIRLFQRKWQWKQVLSIKYPLIADNLLPAFHELLASRFLQDIKHEKQELEVVLDLLNGDQMSILNKKMGTTGKTKDISKKALLNMSRKQKTLLGSSSQLIYEEALKLLGETYKVTADSKNLFSRLFILYSPPQYWEDDNHLGSNQLLSILLVDIGKMKYPVYNIKKKTRIYSSREQLIRFQEAWHLHSELNSHVEAKNWNDVCSIGEECLSLLTNHFLKEEKVISHNSNLPAFLRVYTAASVLTHTLWLSVQAHQKLKQYLQANEIINFLLNQSVYLSHYRARWYERLIVNSKHLRTSVSKTLELVKNALEDEFAQDSHKYMLTNRYEKILEGIANRSGKLLKNVRGGKVGENNTKTEVSNTEVSVQDRNTVNLYHLKHELHIRTIEGEKLNAMNAERGASGHKSVFLGANSASSVELYAMNFYMGQGYHTGVHGEGTVPVSLFGLLFWDVIYNDEISDVFISSFQPFPLDLHFENFYTQRIDLINKKLQKIRLFWSIDDVLQCVEKHWNENVNTVSVVNWSAFASLNDIQSLIKSMGTMVLASICDRLAKNMRHYRSGFPDLVLWDGSRCIFVEVKGPGDSLSEKQRLWIDFLTTIGANVEVCNVKSVSNKRIKIK